MARPIHFEIHAANPPRAMAFYATVFGWTFQQWGEMPYWMAFTGPADQPGINGGLIQRKECAVELAEGQAVNAYVCTLGVDDLDATLASALANGGTLALPRMPIPTLGWLAYVKDTEGNILGLMQADPAAA